ncbi:MAG: hypothetical protein GX633_05105 [Clostridiales bacterium]|nr:hypothetical protein [Clostridiales bacterium]
MGLFTAACLFRDDPRAPAWRESAICWLLDSGMTPLDRVSSRVLSDGKPIGSKVGHITIQPDFTAENHGIVHPDYLGAPLAYRAQFILFSKLAGDTGEIPGIFINWDNIYNKVFKVCASADGGVVPIQSQDWWYYRIGMLNIHIATKLLFDDRHAALLEKKCLHVLETTQAGHDNGTFIDNEPDKCIVSNDFQTLTDMEPSFCSALAVAWLWYMVGGEGVTPVNCEEYEADICRVKHYPHGGTVLQRTKDAFNAFSYRNSAIAFSLPKDKLWTITVPPCSTFGAMKFKDDCSEDYGLSNQDTIRYVENLRVYDDIDTFAAAASINRGLGKARQDVAFVSLPDGVAVYFSRVKAVKDCSIESYTSGLTGVRNEYYKLMPEFAKGYRNIYVDDREPVKMEGYIGGEDIITDFGKARFVAIDDKISYILHGGNNVRYISHHHYPKWKGIEDFLVLNYMENVEMKAGDELPLYVQVCLPNENIEKAREKRLYVSCGGNTDGVILGDRFIFSSLLPSEGLSETSFRIEAGEVPLFEGSVSFRDGIYTHSQTLPVRGCGVRTALAKVKTDRNFDAVVLPCGNTLIRFEGENTYHSL